MVVWHQEEKPHENVFCSCTYVGRACALVEVSETPSQKKFSQEIRLD
jgi:hypothetical protein